MNRGWLLALAVALLAALAWWLVGGSGTEVVVGPGPEVRRGKAAALEEAAVEAKAAPERPWIERGEGSVSGILREFGTERPLGGVAVLLSAGVPGPGRTLETKTLADGSFLLEKAPNFEEWVLRAEVEAPLAAVEVGGIEVIETRMTDLGVVYATPGFEVPGIVVDEAGRPIEGAVVRAVRARPAQVRIDFLRVIRELPRPHSAVETAVTGADGKFAMKKLVPGTYEIEASRKGYRITAERGVMVGPDSAGRELRIVMAGGYVLKGRVVRRTEGPIEGLRVVALAQPDNDNQIFDIFEKGMSVTDDKGEFEVEGLGGGTHAVGVEVEGEPYHLAVDVEIPREGWLEIVIDGDAWLEGRVTDAAAKPIPGAQVYVANFRTGAPAIAFAVTGEDGRYRINSLRSGPVQLFMVQAEGFGTYPEDFMALMRGGGSDLILKPGANEKSVSLGLGGTVRGRVVEEGTGTPIGGVRLSLVTPAAFFGGTRTGTSDADGQFEITSAPVGGSILVAAKDGWVQPGMTPGSMVGAAMKLLSAGSSEDAGQGMSIHIANPGDVVERTMELSRGGVIQGTVVAPSGEPVSGARVSVEFSTTAGGMLRQLSSFLPLGEPRSTGPDGTFSIPSPPAGQKVVLIAKAQGYLESRSDEIRTESGDGVAGVVVKLRQGAVVQGKVTAGGKPLEGALVRMTKLEGEQDWGRRWRLNSARPHRTDAAGAFRIENVETGPILVQFTHPRYISVSREGMEAADGKVVEVDAELSGGGTITGKVTGPDGRPFSGVRIDVTRNDPMPEGSDPYYSPPDDVATAADGTFTLEGLAPGRYTVFARAEGAADSDPVIAEAGGPPLALRLSTAYTISGLVRTRTGQPLSNVRVLALRKKADGEEREGSANTNREGRFEIRDLPQGNYDVRAEAGWGIGSSRPNLIPATVSAVAAGTQDLIVEVEEGLRISGVVLLGDGTPVPEGWINAQRIKEAGDTGPDSNANGPLVDGKFDLAGLLPGKYSVNVGGQNLPWKSVIAAAGATDVRIQYGLGGGIEGRVTLPDGSPATGVWVVAEGPDGNSGAATDGDGNYAIKELPAGTYRVAATRFVDGEGAEAAIVEGVGVSNGGPTSGVDLALEKR